jgi:AIG2 family protein
VTRLWYFAYGSNMESATLRGRRGIEFSRALPARALGWRLVLDKPPLVPVGGSFANIVPDPDAEVLGVAFEVTVAELEHIELTEGVRVGNYRRVDVALSPIGTSAETLTAVSLTSERRDPTLRPTRRYMACLVAGAEEHGLPAAYVAFLRTIPADEESDEARELRAQLDAVIHRRTRRDG